MNSKARPPEPLHANVCIHLTLAIRQKASGECHETAFEAELQRLKSEELEPNGLTLLTRDLADGRSRFLVKDKGTGTVCAMMDFTQSGRLETGRFHSLEYGIPCGVTRSWS